MCLSGRVLTSAAILSFWFSGSAVLTSPTLAATTIYSYTTDEGVPTFTNELESVPEKYRDQLTQQDFDQQVARTHHHPPLLPIPRHARRMRVP